MTTAHLPGKGRSLGGDTKELLVGPDVEFHYCCSCLRDFQKKIVTLRGLP